MSTAQTVIPALTSPRSHEPSYGTSDRKTGVLTALPRSGREAADRVADQLDADDEKQHRHDHRAVLDHPCLQIFEDLLRLCSQCEVDRERSDHAEASDQREDDPGDRFLAV